MKKKFFIGIFAVICSFGAVHAQEKLKEFLVSKDEEHNILKSFDDYGKRHDTAGVVVINTLIRNMSFGILSVDKNRLIEVVPDTTNHRYILIIKPNDKEYRHYTITLIAPGFKKGEIKGVVVKEKLSSAYDVNPKDDFPNQYEKPKYRMYVPFAFPIGNLGKGSTNWAEGGNAWSNYPFDLSYFFEDNQSLSKAAMGLGVGLGAKTIIPLKKSTTAIMVQTEYLLTLPKNGRLMLNQPLPADVLYYQYNPSSGLNNIQGMSTDMNITLPRLNTMDVMLGINKKFRNIVGSSHLEIEGAAGAAWHWSSGFSGKSTTPGEFNFAANYDIFSKTPSLAFEAGVSLTLGSHLSIGFNYVYLGGFDVKGHASWSSTVIPANDANINNVDFNFGHVTVHYMGLILNYSVQQKKH